MAPQKRGFTLLEVSIVMVVISLISGAILVGRHLIRNAEIQSINGEVQGYIIALKAFQDKYLSMPGDFPTATLIFAGTSDGNGDGLILGVEQFKAWQHLALAKMVEGSFSGSTVVVAGNPPYYRVPGTNIPHSRLSGAGWGLIYVRDSTSGAPILLGDGSHVLWLGGVSTTGNNDEQMPVLTTEEAELIDQKFDDGLPTLGKIYAQNNSVGGSCYISSGPAFPYNLAVTDDKICSLIFRTGF